MTPTIPGCALSALLICMAGNAQAIDATRDTKSLTTASTSGYQPRTARGKAVHAIVLQWAPKVRATYGTPPQRWANAMRATFARAPLASLQAAAKAVDIDTALALLAGGGIPVASKQNGVPTKTDITVQRNLVYTMLATPCRIIDTRTVARPLLAGESRGFGFGYNFMTAQGGAPNGCGIPAEASAVTFNVTAVSPTGAGYLTVYPYGTYRPTASSLNYRAGDIVGNEIIARQARDDVQTALPSFSMYSFAETHVVVDVSGYFAPPIAQPLQCIEVASAQATIAAGASLRVAAPACPAGYTSMGGGCSSNIYTSVSGLYFSNFGPSADSAYVCDGNNNRTSSTTFTARGVCCRIPGI